MKNTRLCGTLIYASAIALMLTCTSCDSNYTPQTVPDITPPVITVRLMGEGLNRTYTINGVTISPLPPYITPDLNPGKVYRAIVSAHDTIGLYNLSVSMLQEYFEITDIIASPGVVSTSTMGLHSVVDVTLPISPAKTGSVLSFSFKAKPMSRGIIAPYLGMNIFASDFGDARRSSNISGYTIPIAYHSE